MRCDGKRDGAAPGDDNLSVPALSANNLGIVIVLSTFTIF